MSEGTTQLPKTDGGVEKQDLLMTLTGPEEALLLRKCIRKVHEQDPKNLIFASLAELIGDDTEPLPPTPPFVDVTARFRGRGMRNRGGMLRGRGRGRGRPNSREYGSRGFDDKGSSNAVSPDLLKPPPPLESMQEFFASVQDLEINERNAKVQQRMQELMNENKQLRETNRKLAHQARLSDLADQESIKNKPMNVNAKEFKMGDQKEEKDGKNIKEVSYQDFVQMRRQEQDYEEMIAEQMYLEELEMRRYQDMYRHDQYGVDSHPSSRYYDYGKYSQDYHDYGYWDKQAARQ